MSSQSKNGTSGTAGSALAATPREFDASLKVLIVGETAVGKSCFLLRFTDGSFNEVFMATIGVDFKYKRVIVDDKVCKLQIWDTAGQQRFRNITSSFYRGAHGVIIMFDVTEPNSFKRIQGWMNDIKRFSSSEIPVLLVGNKCDLNDMRCIDTELGKETAQKFNIPYMEASAKTGQGVEEAFTTLTRMMLDAGLGRSPSSSNLKFKSNQGGQDDVSCCTIL